MSLHNYLIDRYTLQIYFVLYMIQNSHFHPLEYVELLVDNYNHPDYYLI
jgi:hypothetical protein